MIVSRRARRVKPPHAGATEDVGPHREDAEQGALGDGWLIAVVGAVAGHAPGEITRRVLELPAGGYLVQLAEARRTNAGAVPTGRVIDVHVTPEVPVYDHSPHEPAYAGAAGVAAWPGIVEKAFAGVDQTWTVRRHAQWEHTWAAICAADAANPRVANPRGGPAPSGYVRLNQETTALDHAEALTQLTGRPAMFRPFPARRGRTRRALRCQLRAAQPVIVTARSDVAAGEMLPYRLIVGQCYEVTAVRFCAIRLRNPWGFYHPAPIPLRRLSAVMAPGYVTLA